MVRVTVNPRTFDTGALRRGCVVLGLGGLFALIVALRLPFCPMAGVLGVPCPGCGLTRATFALVHGDVHGALHLHPLVFVIAPLFLGAVASAAFSYVRGPRPRSNAVAKPWLATPLATALAMGLLALTLGVWVARFCGYFGGPAPVQTIGAWAAQARANASVLTP